MSETFATYHTAPESKRRPPLTTLIRWTRVEEGLPSYGQTVVVWSQPLGLVLRAYRDAASWRLCGSGRPAINAALVTAWTALPEGPLPPPDAGGAA